MQQKSVDSASFLLDLLAQQQIPHDRVLEGRDGQQRTATRSDPINNHVLDLGVTRASPLKAGAQNGIEVPARVIEGFKI